MVSAMSSQGWCSVRLAIRWFSFMAVCLSLGLMCGCRGAGMLPSLPPAVATATFSVSPSSITPGNHATLTPDHHKRHLSNH